MAKLSTKQRNSLPKPKFELPKRMAYPMPDRSHAANAKARAEQQYEKGNLSKASKEHIDAMANRILEHGHKKHRMEDV